MTFPAPINEQLDRRNTALALLAEMHFTTGVMRVASWASFTNLMGQDWMGVPGMVDVSSLRQSERIEYPALDLTLSIADPEVFPKAIGQESTYRGQLIQLYLVVMNDAFQVIDSPQLVWVGLMDQVNLSTGNGADDKGALRMRCEQPGKDSRNPMSMRLNDAQQQLKYPGDTGLSRMAELAGKPQPWASVKFQKV